MEPKMKQQLKLSRFLCMLILVPLAGVGNYVYGQQAAPSASSSVKGDTFVVGVRPNDLAIDRSGDVWITNKGNGTPGTTLDDSNVTELSNAGNKLGTFVAGSDPNGIAIDKFGDIWITNSDSNNVTELGPSGKNLGTYAVGNFPVGITVDPYNNIWVANAGSNNITELDPTGSIIGTFSIPGQGPKYIASFANGDLCVVETEATPAMFVILDNPGPGPKASYMRPSVLGTYSAGTRPSGLVIGANSSVWVTNQFNGVGSAIQFNGFARSLSMPMVGRYGTGYMPEGIAMDSSQNVWVASAGDGSIGLKAANSKVVEFHFSGGRMQGMTVFTAGTYPQAIAIDQYGDVWVVNRGNTEQAGTALGDGNVTKIVGVASGSQYWPYSNQVFPGGGNF